MVIRQKVSQKKKWRIRLKAIACIFLLAAIGALLYRFPPSLQDISRFTRSAAGKFLPISSADKLSAEPVLRGTIFDRNFDELAVSYSLFTLYVHPADLDDRHQAVKNIAAITGKNEEELLEKLKQPKPVIALARNLDQKEVDEISGLGLDGVSCLPAAVRYYPAHAAGAYIVGFTQDNVGLAGAEFLYDKVLKAGSFRPDELPDLDFQDNDVLGENRSDLVLTVDITLQKQLEKELTQYLKAADADHGIAMVLDIKNGNLLAMAAAPGFDPNYFWQREELLANSSLTKRYSLELLAPLLTRIAALKSGYDLGASLLPPTVAPTDFGVDHEYFVAYARELGVYSKIPWQTGFNEKTGDSSAEENVTFVQLATTVAGLANGGWRVTPRIFAGVYDHSLQKTFSLNEESSITNRERMLPPAEGIWLRREFMQYLSKEKEDTLVFDNSLNLRAQSGEYQQQELFFSLGKSTSQNTLFIMAATREHLDPVPSEAVQNQTKLYAQKITAARNLMQYSQQEVARKNPGSNDPENLHRFLISRRLDYTKRAPAQVAVNGTMPDLSGMSLRKGLQRLQSHCLAVNIKGSGKIIEQFPEPGTAIAASETCKLILKSSI